MAQNLFDLLNTKLKIIEDKDAENTIGFTKYARQVFQEYFKEKKTTEAQEKAQIARGLKTELSRSWLVLSASALPLTSPLIILDITKNFSQ